MQLTNAKEAWKISSKAAAKQGEFPWHWVPMHFQRLFSTWGKRPKNPLLPLSILLFKKFSTKNEIFSVTVLKILSWMVLFSTICNKSWFSEKSMKIETNFTFKLCGHFLIPCNPNNLDMTSLLLLSSLFVYSSSSIRIFHGSYSCSSFCCYRWSKRYQETIFPAPFWAKMELFL